MQVIAIAILVSFLLTEDAKFHLRVFVLAPIFGVIVHAIDTTASFSGSPPDRGFQLIIVFWFSIFFHQLG